MQNGIGKLVLNMVFLLSTTLLVAQGADVKPTLAGIDSISYQQFLVGDWDGLVATAGVAKANNIDFKWLQQRLGYAWYVKGDYYRSKKHYLNALSYDNEDEITHLYLYYNYLHTGHLLAARLHAGKLSEPTRSYNQVKAFHALYSMDAEYSFKRPELFFRENDLREDAHFRRIGLLTLPTYRLSLYQSLSGFQQEYDYGNNTNQLEYSAFLSWQATSTLNFTGGYRYVGTRSVVYPDTFYTPGNSFSAKLNYNWHRFDLAGSYHHFTTDYVQVNQWGIHLGTGFSGRLPVYLKSSLYRMNETGTDYNTLEEYNYPHIVFNQTAGVGFLKGRLWIEGSTTWGDQRYFMANDGLYFYNSLDPVVVKTGGSITAYLMKNLALTLHYGVEKKHLVMWDEYYKQHGITGGIQWKM